MGENGGCTGSGGSLLNGLLPGAGSVMRALDTARWTKAEERTADLIACIQPNELSEQRRSAVADYVQRLIMKCFPCQVCAFGSVPLKTYLPDGDIDLTAFSQNQNVKETWANQVQNMLENEEKNENAEFHVKEVQYIQAEVKIIKCLVANIVVDISFNQVGGLCTLCFLDEVDNLISQSHLFKRSIILIKAWCYYESRVLGAHHGLISTYALETLVLYIFHVFNNSFHGPLEVLYRFLEFFSNFDWDNFCVSLWGPVPISSLPDGTAEPPRKDSGELLLSKLFLDACSSVYAVFPGGQENSGRPFVSKHFNVIDPLRVNNNLGRSVSKGNFFRIRSAFSFGAKKLARFLDCPKENLDFEVNQFFMNTWERHGSGHRPDAPGVDSWHLRMPSPYEMRNSSSNNIGGKKLQENFSAQSMEGEDIRARVVSSQHVKNLSRTVPVTNELSASSHAHGLKSQFNLNGLQYTDKTGSDELSDQAVLNDNIHRDLKTDLFVNDSQGRLLFARTHSSPDLTNCYSDDSSQVHHNRQAETAGTRATYSRMDSSNRKKNLASESIASHSNRSSVEDTSLRHALSPQSLDAVDSSSISNSYHFNEEFFASHVTQPTQQEEQDIVNLMSSASLQGLNGQVHAPLNPASGHLPFSIPPSFLASMGCTHRNIPGFVPANIPLMDPSFSHLPFPHNLVPPHLTHYFPGFELHPSEDLVEQTNEKFGPVENSREANGDLWPEHDMSSSTGYDNEKNFDLHQFNDKPSALTAPKYVPPPSRVSGSGSSTRFQQKHLREKHGAVQENLGNFPVQDARGSEAHTEERSCSSKLSSATRSNSLRSRTSSESSSDGSSMKMPKSTSTKEKRGKKVVPTDLVPGLGKGKIMSDHMSNDTDDDDQDLGSLLNVGTGITETNLGAEPNAHIQIPRHQMTGIDVARTSGSESVIPFTPMLIGPGSRQRTNDNSGLIAFYPTGPPIPFLTMLPVYNIPPETGPSDASSSHFGGDETLDSEFEVNMSPKQFQQSYDLNPSSSFRGPVSIEPSEEQKPDILNSDFASHWQNLQIGRFCQNQRYPGPLLYPSPVVIPPFYVQGQFPYDNPGRPLPTNSNIFSHLMTNYGNRMLPVSPLQSVSGRNSSVYQSYVDEIPRHRSGTGTYLPNPKVYMRERHSSSSRRGNYNHDRNDNLGDRDGNWNNSKARAAALNQSHNQFDKSIPRADRYAHSDIRGDRSWNTYRPNSIPPYQSQNGSMRSNTGQSNPQAVACSMYPLAATNPTGLSNGSSDQPYVMLYPLDHSDQLEFGSLGPVVGFPGANEQLQLNDGSRAPTLDEYRHHGNFRHHSSPDQPSSPHHQRRI